MRAIINGEIPSKVKLYSQKINGFKDLKSKSHLSDLASTPFQILGYRGRTRLLYYPTQVSRPKHNIYIVPSLINQYYILDLYPGSSLIEDLNREGYDVYLLDWQRARPQDRYASLETHIFDWLDWGFNLAKEKSNNRKKWSILGHCIGGTFTSVYQAVKKHRNVSLINLTAPIDFYDEGIFSIWGRHSSVDLALMSKQWGEIHHEFLFYSFKMATPLAGYKKWKSFWQNSHQEKYRKRFVCLDHWIKDHMPFPGDAYQEFIKKFYQNNSLINNNLEIGDKKIDLSKIKNNTLILTAKGDTIVKHSSAVALRDHIKGNTDHYEVSGGHIGCLLSSRGRAEIVHQVNKFLGEKYVQ